jgi:hypothetical protein
MKFMIASLYELKNVPTNEKALAPIFSAQARFSYDDL